MGRCGSGPSPHVGSVRDTTTWFLCALGCKDKGVGEGCLLKYAKERTVGGGGRGPRK